MDLITLSGQLENTQLGNIIKFKKNDYIRKIEKLFPGMQKIYESMTKVYIWIGG